MERRVLLLPGRTAVARRRALNASELRARLAKAQLPEWTPRQDTPFRQAQDGVEDVLLDLVPAAVLVPIILHREPAVLLTKRTAGMRKHPGQVSFPGGRIDPEDADAEAAALREAMEEIALDPGNVEIVGRMATYTTGTGYCITPVLGLLPPGLTYVASPEEVETVFELPFSTLLDPAAPRREMQMWRGRMREYWVWPHAEHRIWGATAAILVHLADQLRK